ncbi:hypothetical protein PIB30_086927, partial [Stylosanthes scabra]|nr:hypothetical protein [Stylosanthes scabra]
QVLLPCGFCNLGYGRRCGKSSNPLIDMESGELMLRIHDECLVLQVYKAMHPPRDSMNCMKMEEVDPTSTKPPDKKNKGSKNKSKEENRKTIDSEELQQIPKAPNVPSLPAYMGSISKASFKDVSNHYFEPP